MVKIIGKIVKNNEVIAYSVDDDGVVYDIPERGLYSGMLFDEMLNSGYIYHDYHGNITTPEGINIKDVKTLDKTLTDRDMVELMDMVESGILSEAEVVKHFKRDTNIEYVNIKEPVEVNITDADLMYKHFDTISKLQMSGITKFNITPLNAITDKNILPTIEDIFSNKNKSLELLHRVYNANIIHNKESFNELKIFLHEAGVLENYINPTQQEFLLAFFAWGVNGINANIVDIRIEDNPVSSPDDFYSNNIPYGLDYCLSDGDKIFHEKALGEPYADYINGDEIDVTSDKFGKVRLTDKTSKMRHNGYKSITIAKRSKLPQIRITMLTDDGVQALFVADINNCDLYINRQKVTHSMHTFKYKAVDGIYESMEYFFSDPDLLSDRVLLRKYTNDYIKTRIVEASASSSFDALIKEGYTPLHAIGMVTRDIKDKLYNSLNIDNVAKFAGYHYDAQYTLQDGFSDKLVSKYLPDVSDYRELDLQTQVSLINEEIERLIEMNAYQVGEIEAGSVGFDKELYEEIEANEVPNMNYALSVISGVADVAEIGIGKALDNDSSKQELFKVLYNTYCYAKHIGECYSVDNFLNDVVDKYIDFEALVPMKSYTAKGAIKDRGRYRGHACNTAKEIIKITRVYRELSNKPLESIDRHYSFECKVFDKTERKNIEIFRGITTQIRENLLEQGLDYSDGLYQAGPHFTACMLFDINEGVLQPSSQSGNVLVFIKESKHNGRPVEIKFQIAKPFYENLMSGSMFTYKYCTLFDFCEEQFEYPALTCNFYCINADINPWFVNPKGNAQIPEYNLYVNYFSEEELIMGGLPESVIQKYRDTNARVHKCLREALNMSNMLVPKFDDGIRVKLNAENCNMVLEKKATETLDNYIARFVITNNKVTEERRVLETMVSKADIAYKNYSEVYGTIIYCEDTTFDDLEFAKKYTNRFRTVCEPRLLTRDWYKGVNDGTLAITSTTTRPNIVRFDDLTFDEIKYNKEFISKDAFCGAVVTYNVNALTYTLDGVIHNVDLSTLSQSVMEDLCEKRIATRLNSTTYLLDTVRGLAKVEV